MTALGDNGVVVVVPLKLKFTVMFGATLDVVDSKLVMLLVALGGCRLAVLSSLFRLSLVNELSWSISVVILVPEIELSESPV